MGSVLLWQRRTQTWTRLVLAAAVAATGIWAAVLLGRSPGFMPGLAAVIAAVSVASALAIVVIPLMHKAVAATVIAVALAAAFAGPASYTVNTVLTPHSGAIPSAGPAVAADLAGGGPAGLGRGLGRGGFGRGAFPGGGVFAPGGFAPGGFTPGGFTPGSRGFGAPGNGGSFLNASAPGADLVKLLQHDASGYTWVAATIDANSAAGYQLATKDPVMAIGGFNGTDPAPTLALFEEDVAQGRLHYFIGGGFGPGGGSGTSSQIAQWVEQHFAATTVDGVTVYDLTQTSG